MQRVWVHLCWQGRARSAWIARRQTPRKPFPSTAPSGGRAPAAPAREFMPPVESEIIPVESESIPVE
eukprot:595446-Prorocentrum_minimum.AAC.1